MKRANVLSLILAASTAFATNVLASGAPSGNLAIPVQSTTGSESPQNQTDMVMTVPLLVYVDARGQVRSIEHSQRLPTEVNNLLWQSVKSWTKSSAVINGRHEGAQVLMNVTLHAQPQSGGKTNVYFTLASEGPVLRGYWRMRYNYLYGRCDLSGDMRAGVGGKTHPCTSEIVPISASSSPEPAVK